MNNIKRILIVLLFVFIQIGMFAQININKADSIDRSIKFFPIPFVGDVYQGYNSFECGIKIMPVMHTRKPIETTSLMMGCDFFPHHRVYTSPFAAVKFYHRFRTTKKLWGFNLQCTYWLLTAEGVTDQRLTPEIGLLYNFFCLSYGLNIPISSDQVSFIGLNRVSLRFIIM